MRLAVFTVGMFLSVSSYAMDGLNHLTCEYGKMASGWEYYAANYIRDAFSLTKGEARQLVAAWTDDREVNLAYCTMMVGTEDDLSIEIVSSVFQASHFKNIDPTSCIPFGDEVQLIKQESNRLHRGEVASFTVENWFLDAPQSLLLKQYLPLKEEADNVAPFAEQKCLSLLPQ